MARVAVEIFDLGLPDLDGPGVLERLLARDPAGQGFLIEKSGEGEERLFLGAAPFETLRVRGGKLFQETRGCGRVLFGNPFQALGRRLAEFRVQGRVPPFLSGAVGTLGYEMARHLERLPLKAPPEEGLLMLFKGLLFCDRRRGKTSWAALVPAGRGRAAARAGAGREAERMGRLLREVGHPPPEASPRNGRLPALKGAMGRARFLRGVRRLKEHIRAGDIFQGVLSESFTARAPAGPYRLYRSLRALGPSPYLFWLGDGARHLIGASPERLVRVVGGFALNCPIAGTRPRGRDAREDRGLERSLRRSPKERAEHLMLVDLGRNDLGRVCRPGSVRVRELMAVRRLPNVMHLVSEVEGRLEPGLCAWDALAVSFPAGTVSGAPKVRAMELLAGLEPRPRGFYAGAVLQHDFSGNLDSCIAIRTLAWSGGKARLQAGAGIVADSRPEKEYEEVMNKLLGLRRAIAGCAA